MKKSNILITTTLIAGLTLASSAYAKTYSFEITDIYDSPGSDDAGDITYFGVSYNSDTQRLNFQSAASMANGRLPDAFWLVLSDGPDPLIDRNEYAIFYGDSYTGNLSAYVYNGLNSGSSWKTPGEFIETFTGAFESDTSVAGEVAFSFSVDVSYINNYQPTTPGMNDWDGAMFGDRVGIWYHPVVLDNPSTYNADGSLATFPEIVSGFYDAFDQPTTVTDVPEPGILALTSIGLIGMLIGRRRKKTP